MMMPIDPDKREDLAMQRLYDAMHYLVATAPGQKITITLEEYNKWRKEFYKDKEEQMQVAFNSRGDVTFFFGPPPIPEGVINLGEIRWIK